MIAGNMERLSMTFDRELDSKPIGDLVLYRLDNSNHRLWYFINCPSELGLTYLLSRFYPNNVRGAPLRW